MSFDDLLKITCNLYEVEKSQNSIGEDVETETLRVSGIPCRIVRRTEDERTILGREGVVSTHNIYINLTA